MEKGSLVDEEHQEVFNVEREVTQRPQYSDGEQPCYIRVRHILSVMIFFGFGNVIFLRSNLSLAIVAMVNSTKINANNQTEELDSCPEENPDDLAQNVPVGTFKWTTVQQGLLLGCYFYGYITSALPGPWLAKRYGFKAVVGICMFLSSILTLFHPLVASFSFKLFVAVRIILGLLQGGVIPTLCSSFSYWIPSNELNCIYSVCISGFTLAAFVLFPAGGAIITYLGWEALFYITGAFTLMWSLLWFLLVFDTPADHRRISVQERTYIEASTGLTKIDVKGRKRPPTPWRSIMTSLPMWAAIFAHFSYDWTFNTANLLLPTYMSNVMKMQMTTTGVAAGLPYLVQTLVVVGGGVLANMILKRKWLSRTILRKIYILPALLLPSLFILMAAYSGCNKNLAIFYFIISTGILGLQCRQSLTFLVSFYDRVFPCFAGPGSEANLFDLSPLHSGIIFGISGTISTSAGFIAPQVAGFILYPDESSMQWKVVFWVNAGISLFAAIFYIIFGSGKEQPWSRKSSDMKSSAPV